MKTFVPINCAIFSPTNFLQYTVSWFCYKDMDPFMHDTYEPQDSVDAVIHCTYFLKKGQFILKKFIIFSLNTIMTCTNISQIAMERTLPLSVKKNFANSSRISLGTA